MSPQEGPPSGGGEAPTSRPHQRPRAASELSQKDWKCGGGKTRPGLSMSPCGLRLRASELISSSFK